MDRAITTYRLPHNPWSTQPSKVINSLDTTSMLFTTTLTLYERLRHSVRSDEPIHNGNISHYLKNEISKDNLEYFTYDEESIRQGTSPEIVTTGRHFPMLLPYSSPYSIALVGIANAFGVELFSSSCVFCK